LAACSVTLAAALTRTKIALVTGAGSGIGKAAAIALAGDGVTVILAGRRMGHVQAVEAEIRARFGTSGICHSVSADVGDPDAVAQSST
jgi:NADP-dependent 3-hydroxy acid dehydrogenase YdfG